SALVIFPEGTYATPTSRRRVTDSLARRVAAGHLDTAVVDYARSLASLLPPKPAGTLALLSNRPDADVVILGHVGLEGVAQFRGLRRQLPLRHPVVLRWWIHPREHLPHELDKLEAWLRHRWIELDQWVTATMAARGWPHERGRPGGRDADLRPDS
ncbi:MAG: acyltransferase, partial [Acidimicrobiia bacterium]|nr:acyltransferase [Acidimicrobiia bacterium]